MSLDPITYALVRNSFRAVAREIFTVFKRTAMLPVLYESNDFGISIYDDKLNLIADAPGVPIFIGSLDYAIRRTIDELGGADQLNPGDVLFNNHPFLTGGQPPDAAMIQPIFHREKLIGYIAIRAHLGDFGSKDPYPTDSTEIFQEGVLFPALKLYEEGRLNETIPKILKANSRMPVETVGCMFAAAGAARLGTEKMTQLVEKYGQEAYYDAIDRMLADGERASRTAIEAMTDGVYSFEDYMDDNGVDSDPVKVAGTITISGSDVTIDLSDSAPQQGGPINSPLPYTVTHCRFVLKLLTTPDLPPTSGEYAPLTVIAPEGGIFNPVTPAPTFLGCAAGIRLNGLIIEALRPAMPMELPAPNGGDYHLVMSLVERQDKSRFEFFFDQGAPGHGATSTSDGMSGLFHPLEAGGSLSPAEVMENRMPVIVWRAGLRQDSGGPGQFRGGLSAEGEYELLGDGTTTVVAERSTSAAKPSHGIEGGLGSQFLNSVTLFPGTDKELRCGKRCGVSMTNGDRIIVQPPGGGGYGDPLDRDVERVALDVRDEYVSVGYARSAFGVVFDPATKQVDREGTEELRKQLRSARDEHAQVGVS